MSVAADQSAPDRRYVPVIFATLVAMVALRGIPAGATQAQPAPPAPALAPAMIDDREHAARLQALLARSGFSPGLIDAKPGRKTRLAIEHFQLARGLSVTGELDRVTAHALLATVGITTSADAAAPQRTVRQELTDWAWTMSYTLTERDLAMITGPIPQDWNERALLELSGYEDLIDLLSERGWASRDLLAWLNPGVDLAALVAGDAVTLPNVPEFRWGVDRQASLPRIASLEIMLSEKLVLGHDASGVLVFMTHCSIARDVEKRPEGELRVSVIATDPDYTFNPASWPEVTNVDRRLRIAPGPRNPVGLAWIGLDLPGYGLHGTVRPQDIGKTGSHGCFRLANWDAARLARAVRVGTVVRVQP
jgi:hypothetical protein